MSQTNRPPTPAGRALARLSHRPVSRVGLWDNPDFDNWLPPEMAAARTRVTQLVQAHLAEGSLDEAHGDVADRIVHAVTNVWRLQLYSRYVDADQALEEARLQGQQHLVALQLRVRRDTRRRATAAANRDSATLDLTGEDLPAANDLDDPTTEATTTPTPAPRTPMTPPFTQHTTRTPAPTLDTTAATPAPAA